jgi:hypothetical protein
MTAGDALRSAGFDVAAVRRALPHVEPYAVPVRIASHVFRFFWARGIVAVAMPWAIYVTDTVAARLRSGAEPERSGSLIVHELAHLEQYARLGPVRHLTQYLGDYLRSRLRGVSHWDAYQAIRLEVEAREIAAGFDFEALPR